MLADVSANSPSRRKLPHLRPENENVHIWSLIGKFAGQDLTKISLPVILCEPLTLLQKACENANSQESYLQKAAKTTDSCRRLAMTIAHSITQFNATKGRTKKQFNPLLGETYELVTDDYRFFAEQVSHHPPVTAYYQEGNGYSLNGFLQQKSKFGFGGGRGLMLVNQIGHQDYHFEQYDETITIGRPPVHACNLVVGQLYVDVDGQIEAINHKTGDRADIKFNLKGWTTQSTMEAKIFDGQGVE